MTAAASRTSFRGAVQRFAERVRTKWLPDYCLDSARRYDPVGFKEVWSKLAEPDARDCMLAIDQGVVVDVKGGRWRAALSSADEVMFWEGRKDLPIRPITLWLEPVITIAAVGRLHARFGWPKEHLAMQPKGWAMDFAAYAGGDLGRPRVFGEVKKSSAELKRLRRDLLSMSEGGSKVMISTNSAKKWQAILDSKPATLWLLGPNEESYLYTPVFRGNHCELRAVGFSALGAEVSAAEGTT
jgi:hypothetical protein